MADWERLYGFPAEGSTMTLPCGYTGYFESTGYRCSGCMAIYGSVGCSCTNNMKNNKVRGVTDDVYQSEDSY